jgi:acetolactate synthase-1/2/3 large subunit
MYVFMDRLADVLGSEDVLVTGNGFDVVSCYQAFKVKEGQRVLFSGNWGSMGWDLPLAIGACCGRDRRPVVLVTGDGSIQCNLQELLTVKYYRLPLKLFIYSNEGYGSIRATQKSLFDGRLVGADPSSGVGCLDMRKLADLYEMDYQHIADNDAVEAGIRQAVNREGPVLCEVTLSRDQVIAPKASAFRRSDGTFESRPLEDMAPFLPRDEVRWNMHLFDEDAAGRIEEKAEANLTLCAVR